MPYVKIEITDGATYEQKLQIYKETTEMLQRILNKKPEYTFVVIEEVDNKSWGHMGTSVHEIRMAQAAGVPIPAMGKKAETGKAAKKAPAKARQEGRRNGSARTCQKGRCKEVMPEILVHIVEGRTPESKKALMKDITDAVVKNFGVPAERVVVQIVESPRDSKSRGGIPFSEL